MVASPVITAVASHVWHEAVFFVEDNVLSTKSDHTVWSVLVNFTSAFPVVAANIGGRGIPTAVASIVTAVTIPRFDLSI